MNMLNEWGEVGRDAEMDEVEKTVYTEYMIARKCMVGGRGIHRCEDGFWG